MSCVSDIKMSENIPWAQAHVGTVVTGNDKVDVEQIAHDIVEMLGLEPELLTASAKHEAQAYSSPCRK